MSQLGVRSLQFDFTAEAARFSANRLIPRGADAVFALLRPQVKRGSVRCLRGKHTVFRFASLSWDAARTYHSELKTCMRPPLKRCFKISTTDRTPETFGRSKLRAFGGESDSRTVLVRH